MRACAITAATLIGIGMTAGVAVAHAAPENPDQPPEIEYSATLVDGKGVAGWAVASTLKNGIFELTREHGAAQKGAERTIVHVKDARGRTAISFPLQFEIGGVRVPVEAEVGKNGRTLDVVPTRTVDLRADSKPVAVKPIASPGENQQAMSHFASQFSLATAIGGFVGTAVGAAIGCLVSIPAGCLTGVLPGAGIGGILGTIAVGGPTLVAAGLDFVQTLQAGEGTTRWATPK
ncbi:hypothetical protein [Nocardia seriolae]|uniref:DUF8020 domain-containing protein n=2 Tax=Nocardia seriolae TaxID=37332 RepID=A0A0B8NR92_9NOCA|nr:hypothetical protein [Nocardia seriolae]APA96298.1 hypothetical protein NS506_02232 [Nocardia seriolae]MTJ65644.1 hypothetical protein [Nocardia seriolae]MTJ75849.1 hypothetical protein [Nocardia seriolae]MTJ86425.1 hypothetical protein [Nocardia seriolae]MTK30417.1 hypothetical protein [Nocardia seriolae]